MKTTDLLTVLLIVVTFLYKNVQLERLVNVELLLVILKSGDEIPIDNKAEPFMIGLFDILFTSRLTVLDMIEL